MSRCLAARRKNAAWVFVNGSPFASSAGSGIGAPQGGSQFRVIIPFDVEIPHPFLCYQIVNFAANLLNDDLLPPILIDSRFASREIPPAGATYQVLHVG
jgi:hypothetical protein